jgi:hypothetical protein
MKLKSGVAAKSRRKRALKLAQQQLETYLAIQEEKGKSFLIETKRRTVPVKVKIQEKQQLIENLQKKILNK